jgi:hypothetical protein
MTAAKDSEQMSQREQDLMAQLQVHLDESERLAEEYSVLSGIPRPTRQQMDDMKRDVIDPLFARVGNAMASLNNFRLHRTPINGNLTELREAMELLLQDGFNCDIFCPNHDICDCQDNLQLIARS